MCGITGFFQKEPCDYQMIVGQMADTLVHRGPDDAGIWCDTDIGIAFGFRRLAILDLSPEGHQPMKSASGRFIIVFNGEIYNFLELKSELLSKGHQFRGGSDTEVMLAAFETWGIEQTIPQFNGMFAFAVWDSQERELWLARDRIGKKPLYYGWNNGCFLFGSELKAIKRHPKSNLEIDRGALKLYVQRGYIPYPLSIYQGIYKLISGSYLRISKDDLPKPSPSFTPYLNPRNNGPIPYWELTELVERSQNTPFRGTETEALDELDRLLRDSTRRRMISDVPLGAFLSGGIDSSLVVAIMQSEHTSPIKTYTIGFEEPEYNEAPFAKNIAEHLKTEHTELYVSVDEGLKVIPDLPQMYDEPLADASQIPTFLLSRLSKQNVTVALSGDGGDELFVGYQRYIWPEKILSRFKILPLFFRKAIGTSGLDVPYGYRDRLAKALAGFLPKNIRPYRAEESLEKFLNIISANNPEEIYEFLTTYWPAAVVIGEELSKPQFMMEDFKRSSDFLDRSMFLDLGGYLPEDLLAKVDRASMAASLEVRSPLLDYRLIEFAASIPSVLRAKKGEKKYLLRTLLSRYVPLELFERPKMGFSLPVGHWLGKQLKGWAEDLLDESLLKREGFFDPSLIRLRWKEQSEGTRNWQNEIWTILMFQSWNQAQHSLNSKETSLIELTDIKISVIIPAYNEEKLLPSVIAAIKANDFPTDNFEIIVIDNGSTDRTAEIAQEEGVILVESERRFVGAARNLGARQARGEFLAFLDADCLPSRNWLEEGLRSLTQEHCVTGEQCEAPDQAAWLEKSWFSQKKLGRRQSPHINSANLFISRSFFNDLGGFDESLSSGEDYELCSRASSLVRIIADNKIRVVHLGNPKTVKDFLTREIWHGIGALGALKHKWFDKPLLGTLIFTLISLLQIIGLMNFFISHSIQLFLAATMGMVGLLVVTVFYRLLSGGTRPRYTGNLILLYYLYYLGRMIALGLLLIGRRDFQRTRNN